jgi:hypothetical protein
MDEQRKRMAGMSNDNGSRPFKYLVPLIRFNGNTGEFRKVFYDGTGAAQEAPLTKPIKLVILKKRRIVSSYNANASYFTQEHNTVNDKLLLYKNIEKTVTFEAIGYGPELKQKYQQLKTHEIVYALYDGQVYKLDIKGSSVVNYYDYLKSLSKDDLHSFEVYTSISTSKEKNESLGTWYHVMKFDKAEAVANFDEIEKFMTIVHENTKKMDEFSASELIKKSQRGAATAAPRPTIDPEMKDFAGVAYPKEDINPNDIPF